MSISRPLRTATALLVTLIVLFITVPQHTREAPLLPPDAFATPEAAPLLLTLPEPLNQPRAQLSGLAWYDRWLLLLPQYPDFAGEPALYAIARSDLSAVLDRPREPLPVRRIPLHGLDGVSELPGYEGFEAVASSGESLLFLVELRRRPMRTAIVRGQPAADLSSVTLETVKAEALVAPTELRNLGYEALVVDGVGIATSLYEANGVVQRPTAYRFDAALTPIRELPMLPLPFRLTDATAADEEGRFWVINYFFPGERALDTAPITGGVSHAQYAHVERLVELRQTPSAVIRTATPPLYLRLEDTPRNWEGVVRFDDGARRGFLLVSDRHPTTLLAYVAASPP